MTSSTRAPFILLAIIFVISTLVMWPGIMSPDAVEQYRDALNGLYSDHHPPMMGFIWRYLTLIYTGPGLMLLLHLVMLYAAAAVLIHTFRDSKFKWWFAILPLVPGILVYTPLMAKDVGLAFSYLLAGSLLAYLMIGKVQKYKWPLLTLVLLLLFYGTAVKFQARFILFFFTIGVAFCLFNYKYSCKPIIAGLMLYALLLQAMFSFNNLLVPNVQKSYSWQYVKLYDLSAMSIASDKLLMPEFIKQNPNFSFTRLKQQFVACEIDPLVFKSNSVLRLGRTDSERAKVLQAWQDAVLNHPWLYLKVRFNMWIFTFTGTAADKSNPAKFLVTIPAFKAFVSRPEVYDAIGSFYSSFKVSLQFVWLLPFLALYCYLGVTRLNKSRSATPLLMFSLTSVTLLGILFFMSMAGNARYVFICVCLIHASHGFAYQCLIGPSKK